MTFEDKALPHIGNPLWCAGEERFSSDRPTFFVKVIYSEHKGGQGFEMVWGDYQ